jgi:hypothetical protein
MTMERRFSRRVRCAVAIVTLLTLGACAHKVDKPQIQLTDIGFVLHLPPPMQQALDSLAPGFHSIASTSYRSDVAQAAAAGAASSGGMPALFATVGDFNGDGLIDAVEEGTVAGDSTLRVVAILNGAKPHAVDVARIASFDADAVGFYLTPPPTGQTGAFELVAYPDSSTVYSYDDGAFTAAKIGS